MTPPRSYHSFFQAVSYSVEGGAALRVRGWRSRGTSGAGRTGIGRGRPDWNGLVWETEISQKEIAVEVELSCWPLVSTDLVLLRPLHQATWELSLLVSARAFASFYFSWSPWTSDNEARGAVLVSVVAILEQAAPLVTSPSRFFFWKPLKDLGRESLLLSSLTISFLFKRLQDNHKGTVNSSNQTMFPKYSKRARSCTLT